MNRLPLCVAILCCVATSRKCHSADTPTVEVRGASESTFIPDTVQVRWRVYAHGMTAKSAIKKLNKSRKALEKGVAKLDGLKPAHRFGPCTELKKDQGNLQQMQVQILQNIRGQGDDDDDERLLCMAFTATLEWKLTGKSFEDAYCAVDAMRQQLDELGVRAEADATAKARESEEESKAEADDEDGDDHDAIARMRITDGPRFYFVRRLSEEEMSECTKLAFEDARRRAARLATAAGRSLGEIVHLRNSAVATAFTSRAIRSRSRLFSQGEPVFDEDDSRPPNEIVSDDLKPIRYETTTTVVFTLE